MTVIIDYPGMNHLIDAARMDGMSEYRIIW